jgi:hypothetical protein
MGNKSGVVEFLMAIEFPSDRLGMNSEANSLNP